MAQVRGKRMGIGPFDLEAVEDERWRVARRLRWHLLCGSQRGIPQVEFGRLSSLDVWTDNRGGGDVGFG